MIWCLRGIGIDLSHQVNSLIVQEEDLKMEKPVKIDNHKWLYRGYEIFAGSAKHTSKRGAKYQYRFHTYEVAKADEINKPMMFITKIIDGVVMTQRTHYAFSLDSIVLSIDQIESAK